MANQVAYGFFNLQDLFDRRVADLGDRGAVVIEEAINRTMDALNREIDARVAIFAGRTTDISRSYKTPTIARSQPLDQNGRSLPIKPVNLYGTAFPLHSSGNAWGNNYIAGIKMTVQEANDATVTLAGGDARWMGDHVLAALLTNVSWTFQDEQHGPLTIYGPANGDTVLYPTNGAATVMSTQQMFAAQAAGIADGADNPFIAMATNLRKYPSNQGGVIAFIASNLVNDTSDLATFYPSGDSRIRPGTGESVLVGDLGITVPGTWIGYESKSRADIVEWPSLPDGYIIAVTSDGDPPLLLREEPEAELRGFRQVAERNDHPWYERQYFRRAGFGAWNRVGAAVTLVGAGSYSVPTGYASPMA